MSVSHDALSLEDIIQAIASWMDRAEDYADGKWDPYSKEGSQRVMHRIQRSRLRVAFHQTLKDMFAVTELEANKEQVLRAVHATLVSRGQL